MIGMLAAAARPWCGVRAPSLAQEGQAEMVDRAEQVEMRLSREDGTEYWRAVPWRGAGSGRVPGYLTRDEAGRDIAGMDHRMMRPLLYLPGEGDLYNEIALIAAVTLATFMDPANMGN